MLEIRVRRDCLHMQRREPLHRLGITLDDLCNAAYEQFANDSEKPPWYGNSLYATHHRHNKDKARELSYALGKEIRIED